MSGTASLDIRELPPGYTVDVDTPDGVLTIERAGYYRIETAPGRTVGPAGNRMGDQRSQGPPTKRADVQIRGKRFPGGQG